jgi:hypothetical protein
MSTISAIQAPAVNPPQPARSAPVDADGDHDGTREAAEASAQKVSKPTATLGNKVDTFA